MKRVTAGSLGNRLSAQQVQKALALAMIAAGALLIVAMAIYGFAAQPGSDGAALPYRPEDVAADRPLRAVHEMNTVSPPIPFLPAGGPQPRIVIPATFYDFGSIGADDVVRREFAIFNRGDAPLAISRAYTSCDCTTADFTSAVIPPGKVSLVTVTFDAGFHEEAAGTTVRRTLIIENNDPANPQMQIAIQADVQPRP